MPLMLRIKRAVCLLLALCLLPYGSAFSATSVSPEPHSPSQQVPDLASFILPETLGRVSEKFQGDPESPVIFLIQDAHAVPEAQARIRELLEHLQSVYGTPVAGLEGVVTQLDPLILRSFPDRQVLEEALAEIHERGELAGPSAAAVLSPQASDYEGLEERELYEEGLAFFLEAQRVRALSESALREVRMALEEKKRAAYSPVLLSLDAASRDFYQGRRPLIDLLRMLERVQPPPAGSQIELVLRQEARDKEESARNTSQLRDFARSLQRHYETLPQDHAVREKERALNEYLQLFQTSQTSAQDFALFLYEASRGLPVEQNFPDSYRGGLWASKRLRQLEGTDFFREFAAYAASVKDSLLRNADERALDEASQRLDRAEKWVRLELTFEEWREVENRRAEFEQGLPPDSLQAAEAFYRNAEARDGVMMSRLGAIFQRRRDLSASVVAGGFHTAGLTEALRRQKISFAVVTPEMTSIPEDSPYERQMSGDVSWRSYFRYEKGEVPLYDAFIRGLRDRLMALTDERSGAEASRYVLKRWRDQILRELALRGEIEDASRYTRFLDETAERYRSGRTPGVERVERFIEELKALEKNGALNEQNIARLLMPASRPAEAVQAALEPGARWGGPLLKIERAPEGLTVRVDSEAVSRRVRDFLNESRSELRASSPEDLITQLSQQADLQQLLLKGQSPPLSLSAAEKETLAWAFRAGYVSKSAVFLTLKGMLVTLGFKGMPWDDLAIARAFPALGDYREDALAYLFSRANAGSDSALLALAVIFRDNSASLPEKPLLELRQLIHSRIVTGKKEVYLALSFIQDHIELSDIELKKDLDLIAQGASIYGFGIRAALYVPRADDAELFTWLESVQVTLDALTQNKTAQAQSQTSALYNLRGLGKIATMVDEPTRDKIFNPLFSAAVQTQSGVLELGALEALAEAYPALSTSQKGRVAVLLQKKNAAGGESSEFALLAVQRIRAGIEESKVKADGKTESDLAGLSSLVKSPDLSGALEAILEKHKRDKAAQFVKAMEEKYNAQIFKLAEEGNPKAVEALGYLYAMVPTMEKAKIADLLSTLLEKDGAAGNAAVKAFGTFFAILGEHDRESVFAELKSKAENFNEGAILGLVKIARYYKDNNRQDRFQSIFDLVIGLSQSAYPGSLAAYGKLAAMSGKQSVVEKAYNFLSDAEEPEALLGLAGLYQTIFDLGIKKEISTKIFHEVVAGKPYAMEALGDLGEAASFFEQDKDAYDNTKAFLLKALSGVDPDRFLAMAKILWTVEDDDYFLTGLNAISLAASLGNVDGLLAAAMVYEDVQALVGSASQKSQTADMPAALSSSNVQDQAPDIAAMTAAFTAASEGEPELTPDTVDTWNQSTAYGFAALGAKQQKAFLEKLKALGVPPAAAGGLFSFSKLFKVLKGSLPEDNPFLISMALAYKAASKGEFKEIVKDFPAVILKAAQAGLPEGLIALGHLAEALQGSEYSESIQLLFNAAQLKAGVKVTPKTAERARSALWGLAQVQHRLSEPEIVRYRSILNLSVDFPEDVPWLEAVSTLTMPGASANTAEGQAAYLMLASLLEEKALYSNPAVLRALENAMKTSLDAGLNTKVRQSLLQRALSGKEPAVYPLAAAVYAFFSPPEKRAFYDRLMEMLPTEQGVYAFKALGWIVSKNPSTPPQMLMQTLAKPLSASDGTLMALGIKSVTMKSEELLQELQSDHLQGVFVSKLVAMAAQSGKAQTPGAIQALGKLVPRLTAGYRNALYVMLKSKLNPLQIGPERDAAVLTLNALYPYLEPKQQAIVVSGFASVLEEMMQDHVFNPVSAAMALRMRDSEFEPHKKLYTDYAAAINVLPPELSEQMEALILLDEKLDKAKAEVLWDAAAKSGYLQVQARLIERGVITDSTRIVNYLAGVLNLLDLPSPPASAVRALASVLQYGSKALSSAQFQLGAKRLWESSASYPESFAVLAKLQAQLDPGLRQEVLRQLALNLGSGKPSAEDLFAAVSLKPDKIEPYVFMTLPPNDLGISLEPASPDVRILINAELQRLIDEVSKTQTPDAETLSALQYAKSYAFKILPPEAAEAWLKELQEAIQSGYTLAGHKITSTPALIGMTVSSLGSDHQALKDFMIEKLFYTDGESSGYEGLGYVLSKMPAAEGQNLPLYEGMRKKILNTLDEQMEVSSAGAAEGLSVAFGALTAGERAALVDDLIQFSDQYKRYAVLARIYPFLDEEMKKLTRDEFFNNLAASAQYYAEAGLALPAMAGDDPVRAKALLAKLRGEAMTQGSFTAAMGLAHAFDLLSPQEQGEFFQHIKTRPAEEQLRLLAVVARQTAFMTGSDFAFSALGKTAYEVPENFLASVVPWPAEYDPGAVLQGVPWLEASSQPSVDLFQGYEFDPGRQAFVRTDYSMAPPAAASGANAEARKLMADFEAFEDINAEVLMLLMKPDKSVEEMRHLFSVMEKMVKVYLVLFKKMKPDLSIDAAAKSSKDLAGGRAIAKLFLSLREETEKALTLLQPGAKDSDPLHPVLGKMLQALNARNSAFMIMTPAEQTEKDAPERLQGMTYSEYRHYLDFLKNGGKEEDALRLIQGTSFHELINIVHQKGVRNLSSLFPAGSAAAKGKVQIHESRLDSVFDRNQDFDFQYLDARPEPDGQHPLPVRLSVLALAKHQLIHANHKLFPMKDALILSSANKALINLPLGMHSARIQLSLSPVQETGRIFVNYADSSASYAPGSDIRIEALAEAFSAAGFKVRKVGYTFDAVFDKDNGASSLSEMIEKLEFVIQAFMSTKDLDLEINKTPGFVQPDAAAAVKKLSQRFIRDGYLIRDGGLITNAQAVFAPDLTPYLDIGRQLQVEAIPAGQRYLDRVSRRLQQAADRSEAFYTPQAGLRFNSAYQEQSKRSPVEALLQNLFPDESTASSPSEDSRRTAALGLLIRPFAEHKILASVGRYQVERLVIPLLYEDLTIDLLKDAQSQTYYGASAYLGRFHSTLPTYDRARGQSMAGNKLGSRELADLLRLHGLHQSHAASEFVRERAGKTDWEEKSAVDAVLSNEEVLKAVTGGEGVFDFDGLFQKTAVLGSISAVSIGGLSVQPGKSIGFARFKKENRAPEEFKDSIWIGESADNKDDPHLFASSGIVMTTGGIQSHGAVRAGENRKPGSIFNTARVSPEGLEFEGYSDYAQPSSLLFRGRTLTYEELKAESQTLQTIRDGDLVYLDASAGMLYLIAPASDAGGKTVRDFEAFIRWKQESGYEALRKGQAGKTQVQRINLKPLEDILRGIENVPLLRAILDELLEGNVLRPDDLTGLMSALEDRKDLVDIVKVFLRGRAEQEVAVYEASLKKLLERLSKPVDASSASLDGLYIEVEQFMALAESLEGLIALSNGRWKGRVRAEDIREGRAQVIQSALKQIQRYLGLVFYSLREFLNHAAANPAHELALLMGRRSMILRAGAVASIEEVVKKLNVSGDYQELDARIRRLSQQRKEEVAGLAGFGILWKDALKDRFSRPLAGGKGSNSAETFHAVEFLKAQGLIPEGFKVATPLGFAIQPAEYERWRKDKGDLHPDLKAALAKGYRDLVIRQMRSLSEFLEQDERTEAAVKNALRQQILLPAQAMLPNVEDPSMLSGLVSLFQGYTFALVQSNSAKEISASLINRLQVLGAVAVRSSGLKEDSEEEAMAGMKETRLNVAGVEELFAAVRDVWASGSEAVLVDEMINPKASGTAFSADTATRDLSVVRIEAAHGLAKGLVDQTVKDPDYYLIAKPARAGDPYEIQTQHVGQKKEKVVLDFDQGGYAVTENDPAQQAQPALTASQQLAVAAMVDGFSIYFGNPVDVEFSIDADNRIVPLQVRPITTLRDAVRRGQDYLRSELRSDETDEESFRFIAVPSDWRSRRGYDVKDYAAHIHKGADFYFLKTKAYRYEDLGRFQIGSLTFRLTRFPEAPQAGRPEAESSRGGVEVGAASPKYQLEVYLADESGRGQWRKLEDVEVQDGKPLFIYRSSTKHVSLPGLFDYFMNRSEQNEVSRLLEEDALASNAHTAIVISWKGGDELMRNYYLPSMIRPENPETVSQVTLISRSSADDPDAEARLTINLDAAEKAGAPHSPRGWLAHRMDGFVRPGHLMLMTDVREGQDYVILQNQGSMNGFRAEEKQPPIVPPAGSAESMDKEEQSRADDSWASQSLDSVAPEHSLMLQPRNFVEGQEGKLQFFYNGLFSVQDDSGTALTFLVDEGRLYARLPGRAPVPAPQNRMLVQNASAQPYEVFYAHGRVTVTNHAPDENALIWVFKGGARSELRVEEPPPENLPAVPDAADRQLARAEDADRPRGLMARLTEGLQKRVDKVRMHLAVRHLRRNSENVEVEWLQDQTSRGTAYTLGLFEKILDPAEFSNLSGDAKAKMAFFLLSSSLPEGYEPYVRERLGSLDADSVAGALGYGTGAEEVIPTLLRYNTPESNELVRQLLSHPKAAVRQHAYEHVTVGAINHIGNSEEILRETRFLGEGLSVKQILERFSQTEDQGFYAFVPRLSISDLRRFASLPYEVNVFNLGEGRVVLLKGGERIASAMFPGRATRDSNLHNHPSGMIFPTGYQRKEHGFGAEDYSGDLMVVGTTGFYHIITKEGITRFYREKDDVKGKPGEMRVRFSDRTEIDLKAESRGGVPELSYIDGTESKYFFTDTALRDSSGRVRDFTASGLLGPSGQVFGLQFISWKSLAGSYLEGGKTDAFGRFIPPSMLDPSLLNREDSADFESLFSGVVPMTDAVRSKLDALLTASEKESPAETLAAADQEAAAAASRALVPHRAGPGNSLAASVEDALPPLDQIEIRLQVLLARDYIAGVEFADRYLAAGIPAQVKEAVFKGLAHGADHLLPGDVNRYLNLGFNDSDNRVNAAALELLERAPAGADIAGALRLAFSRHIQMTRLVRMTGRLNLPPEQKKALFLMYTRSSAIYRNAISESFTRDLFGYAPQTLFFSLVEAALPPAMNEEIIMEAYGNLTDFEMQGLEGMTGTHHVPLVPRLNLEDDQLERIGRLVESLGRPRAAQIYYTQMKDRGTVLIAGSGASLAPAPRDARSSLIQELDALSADSRKVRLTAWAETWRRGYAAVKEADYRTAFTYRQELEDVMSGLARWDLGESFNEQLLKSVLLDLPGQAVRSRSHAAGIAGSQLAAIPLSSGAAFELYQALIRQGMRFFQPSGQRELPVVIRAVAGSAFLSKEDKKKIFAAAFSSAEIDENERIGEVIEDDIRRSYYQRERSLQYAFNALLEARFTFAEDVELISSIPLFRGDSYAAVLKTMAALGLQRGERVLTFIEALRTRHPEIMKMFKNYLADKTRFMLEEENRAAAALESRVTVKDDTRGLPELPPGRSELREVLHQVAEVLIREGAEAEDSRRLAAGLVDAVRELSVERVGEELRQEAVLTAETLSAGEAKGISDQTAAVDSGLARFSAVWFVSALETLNQEKFGAILDLPGDEISASRMLEEHPALKNRFEMFFISRTMDASLLKSGGIPVEMIRDPASYRTRFSLTNGSSMPVLTRLDQAGRLVSNPSAFAAVLTGEPAPDDGFEFAALAAMLAGALLTSHYAADAETLKKSPEERGKVLEKVWAALLKGGLYDGPRFLQMSEDGVLSIDRGTLQRFMTDFLARKAVEAAA